MSNYQNPNHEPIIVAPMHFPKTPIPLAGLVGTKSKKAKEDEEKELFSGKKFKAPAGAKLTYRGGPLLTNVEVYTIFWGKKWATDPTLIATAKKLNDFYKAILVSPLMDQMTEYNVPGHSIGHGSFIGTKNITTNTPMLSISDSRIRLALQGWIAAGTVPMNSANKLYFIYFEPNIKVTMGGGASCTSFCGYHQHIGANLFYSPMPYPNCAGCLGGLSAFDSLTGTSSHELCEAVTDPIPGAGWYDDHNGEIGDICGWQFKRVAGYVVQKEWSNALKKCV